MTFQSSVLSFLLRSSPLRLVNYYFNNRRTRTVLKTRIVQSIASCLSSNRSVSRCREVAAERELVWVEGEGDSAGILFIVDRPNSRF